MCTVTIIPTRGGFRLVTNRDESRRRAPALPPAVRDVGSKRLLAPTDPVAGGTWIGASEAGLIFTLLNGNPHPAPALPPKRELRSRGNIVPMLAEESSLSAAEGRLRELDLARFAPFRLVASDGSGVLEAAWDWDSFEVSRQPLCPSCWASSGLGDHLVQVRLPLFEEMVVAAGATPALQDAFHAHRWPEWPQLSVWMEREDARTVSRTVVEVVRETDNQPGRVSMRYEDGVSVWAQELPLRQAAPSSDGACHR